MRGAAELLREARPILSCSLHNREEEGGILGIVGAAGYRGVSGDATGVSAWCALRDAAGNYVHPEDKTAARIAGA